MLHSRPRRAAWMDRLYNLQPLVAHLAIVKRVRSAGRRFNEQPRLTVIRRGPGLHDESHGRGNAALLRTKMQIERWIVQSRGSCYFHGCNASVNRVLMNVKRRLDFML